MYWLHLFYCVETGRGFEHRWNTVNNSCAGMLNSRRFFYKEFSIRLAGYFPVAHIAIVRAVHFADTLCFNNWSLERFCRNDCAHTNAVVFRNDSAEC